MIKNLLKKTAAQAKFMFNGSKLLFEESKQGALLKQKPKLTRNEFIFLHRNTQDFNRLLPCLLIMLILPESIPFWIMKGNVIPSTMITPEQKQKKLDKLRLTRVGITEKLNSGGICQYKVLSQIKRPDLLLLSEYFGMSKWRPSFILRHNLSNYASHIIKDNALLEENSFADLSTEAINDALFARGNPSGDLIALKELVVEAHDLSDAQLLVSAVTRTQKDPKNLT